MSEINYLNQRSEDKLLFRIGYFDRAVPDPREPPKEIKIKAVNPLLIDTNMLTQFK